MSNAEYLQNVHRLCEVLNEVYGQLHKHMYPTYTVPSQPCTVLKGRDRIRVMVMLIGVVELCKDDVPKLLEAHDKYKERGVRIVECLARLQCNSVALALQYYILALDPLKGLCSESKQVRMVAKYIHRQGGYDGAVGR